MKTRLSGPAIRLSKAAPGLAKGCLWAAARVLSSRKPNWCLRRIASEINYRIPVDARLANGMTIRVVWVDSVGAEICTEGCYESETFELMRRILEPGMVFFDIGAHVGQYTLLAAGVRVSVHAFEPDPETFPILAYNIGKNDLKEVCANPLALSRHTGSVEVCSGPADNIGSSFIRPFSSESHRNQIPCMSLDEYVSRNQISRVDLVKIDVEGAELQVLEGARETLSKPHRPKLIVEFCEANQNTFGASCGLLAESLTSLGYKLFRIEDFGIVPYEARKKEPEFCNVLAIP
jgi:FkbM family methyltransferase